MLKKTLKKFYKIFLYHPLKKGEKWLRAFLFSLLRILIPRFNAFRIFGLPSGIKSIPGEEIIQEGWEERVPPKTFDHDLIPRFTPLKILTPGGKLVVIPNGFTTAIAASLTDKGRLIPEFTEQFTLKRMDHHKLFTFRKERLFSSIPHFQGKVASLTVDGQWNYYHWLFDALPKIHLLQKRGIRPDFYYADTTKPFQKDSFAILEISKEMIICPHTFPQVSAEELILTSFPCLQGIPKWVYHYLRETFASRASKNSQGAAKKLFISRKEASYRRLLNEEELLPLLDREGFKIIQPEKLSFLEQVAVFQNAEVILSPHGAGLANLVFCNPGTKVIELFPPRFPCTCYWTLSNLAGLDYFSLRGIDDPLTYSSECEGYDHLLIDSLKVKKILDWAIRS